MAQSKRRRTLTVSPDKTVTFVATGDATVTVVETDATQTVTIDSSAPGGSGITALTGDVTASGSGSVAATIANLAVTTGKIAAGAVTAAKISATLDTIPSPVAPVSFNDQQATSFRIENRTSDPGTPTVGQLWLRTDL